MPPLKIRRALLTVSDPTGLAALAAILNRWAIEAFAPPPYLAFLQESGLRVAPAPEMEAAPEMCELVVAPLPPLVDLPIVGGLADRAQAPPSPDIRLMSLIRAAAYRHEQVAVVTDPAQYEDLAAELERGQGAVARDILRVWAAEAIMGAACHDAAFADSLVPRPAATLPDIVLRPAIRRADLASGAALYADLLALRQGVPALASAVSAQGPPASCDLLCDADLALRAVRDLPEPACALVAAGRFLRQCAGATIEAALATSARETGSVAPGLVVACNRPISTQAAGLAVELDAALLLAPDAEEAARAILANRPAMRVLLTRVLPAAPDGAALRAIDGGFLARNPRYL